MVYLQVKKHINSYQTLEWFNKILKYKNDIFLVKNKGNPKNVITIKINMGINDYLDLIYENDTFNNQVYRFLEER